MCLHLIFPCSVRQGRSSWTLKVFQELKIRGNKIFQTPLLLQWNLRHGEEVWDSGIEVVPSTTELSEVEWPKPRQEILRILTCTRSCFCVLSMVSVYWTSNHSIIVLFGLPRLRESLETKCSVFLKKNTDQKSWYFGNDCRVITVEP